MRTFAKKRLDIVIEAPMLRRLLELLDRLQVSGYTVTPAVAGRGRGGSWHREATVGEAGRMFVVQSIVDPARVEEILEPVFRLVSAQIGIVSVTDVEVIRPDHF
jgi:PII-like signaling protein